MALNTLAYMPLDYFTQSKVDMFRRKYESLDKDELFIALDQFITDNDINTDGQDIKIELQVIEDNILDVSMGYELLNFYKSKIKHETLLIDNNNLDFKEVVTQYKTIFTQQKKTVMLFSLAPIVFFSLLFGVSNTTIQGINLLFFGSATVTLFLWLVLQPLINYIIMPILAVPFEIIKSLSNVVIFLLASIANILKSYTHKQ